MPHDGLSYYRWARENRVPPFLFYKPMNFDTSQNSKDYLMSVNGLSAGLNMPPALKSIGEGENEMVHQLPPYRGRKAFLVDEYPACPATWMRSSGRAKSYFVPVRPNSGLWLDFNSCHSFNVPNHVAIVVSIQGVNAITGMPCKDAQLEQYRDACPKHKEPFGPDRLCKKCNFKWPKANYLASNATPSGSLWLDGFRAEDGVIRQYVFTESKMRGVAAAIIGEDRVFALGISYFLSKEAKPKPAATSGRRGWSDDSGIIGSASASGGATYGLCEMGDGVTSWGATLGDVQDTAYTGKITNYSLGMPETKMGFLASPGVEKTITDHSSLKARSSSAQPKRYASNAVASAGQIMSAPVRKLTEVKQLEVAAGARIDQRIWDDPSDLEFWQKEPEGLIVINYCTEEEAEAIIAAGKVDVSGSQEGYLQKIPTGNP